MDGMRFSIYGILATNLVVLGEGGMVGFRVVGTYKPFYDVHDPGHGSVVLCYLMRIVMDNERCDLGNRA